MRTTVMEERSRPGEVTTAPAAPGTAPAAPGTALTAPAATPGAPVVPETAPPAPRKGGRGRLGKTASGGVPAPAGETDAEARWVGQALLAVACVALPIVGLIGFAVSYRTLEGFARGNGFGWLSWAFPVGIDVSIIGLLAMDLVLIRAGRPKRSLLPSAHLMTAVTIVLNTGAALPSGMGVLQGLAAEPMKALMHGVMPFLFVLGVGALRHWLRTTTRAQRTRPDRIPAHRWILAPVTTGRLYRRMRLASVTSYQEMVKREQDLHGYVTMLKQKLGGDLSKASDIQTLPMRMAPRGFTVEQALALPEEWERQQEERERQEEERAARKAERERLRAEQQREEAERERLRAEREAEEASRARIAALNRQADEVAARHQASVRTHEAAGQAETARVLAEQARRQAERKAQAVEQAEEAAEVAEARRREAEATRKEAEELAEAERLKAEAERLEAEAAEQRRRKLAVDAEAERATADVEAERLRAAEARRRIAVMEAEAATADAWAGLTPREIKVRRVARLIVAAGGSAKNVEVVPLKDIETAVGAARTTAGELRQEAAELLDGGYDPMTAYVPQSWR
ncbi:DUF2637 domain-containing protein [Streptomyces sparsogenes]|uniref:DUF2637 domain-containing protein n=1 Tax=Streptomyces sparsogenes TaxID=67365 RepID=UPI0034033570